MPRRRRGGWALSPWPARSGLLAPREVILPTSHTSRAEGPRPTLPRARQASFPARPPGAPVPRPGKSGSRVKVVAVPSGISRRMPRGASGGEGLAHHQQAGHPPQGTTSSRDGALARERVPWRTRLIYGSGDLFGGGAYNIINFYYLIFLTDVAHVRPALAGIIVLASRIWDAVSDPLMGSITDRTRSRFGRRRPYFLAGSVLIFLAFRAPLVCARLRERDGPVRLCPLLVHLLCHRLHLGDGPLLGPGRRDHPGLPRADPPQLRPPRLLLGRGVAAALVPMPIVRAFPTPQEGYLPMGIIFGLLFAAPWPVIFLHIRERPELQTPLPSQAAAQPAFRRWTRFFLEPLQVRAFRLLVGMHLTAYLTIDVLSALFAYYATYSLGRPGDAQPAPGRGGDQPDPLPAGLYPAQPAALQGWRVDGGGPGHRGGDGGPLSGAARGARLAPLRPGRLGGGGPERRVHAPLGHLPRRDRRGRARLRGAAGGVVQRADDLLPEGGLGRGALPRLPYPGSFGLRGARIGWGRRPAPAGELRSGHPAPPQLPARASPGPRVGGQRGASP